MIAWQASSEAASLEPVMPSPALIASSVSSFRAASPRSGLRALFRVWLGRWRHRRALGRLHPEQMQEVGLYPMEVQREAQRPFWRA